MLIPFLYVMVCAFILFVDDHISYLSGEKESKEYQRQNKISIDIFCISTIIIILITVYNN